MKSAVIRQYLVGGIGFYGVLLCVAALVGCTRNNGPPRLPTFPLKGQVLLDDRPVGKALVVLHPMDRAEGASVLSYARTDSDGRFAVSTYEPFDGAPAGKYAVTILKEDDQEGKHVLPPAYASPDTSGLTITVAAGPNELRPFRLHKQ